MAKISLISWRRLENKFPETEAQRRARARERSTDSDQRCGRVGRLDVLTATPPVELQEFDEERLMEELGTLALLNSNRLPNADGETLDASAESCVSVGLTADQSCALHALPLLSTVSEANAPQALFQLRKSQDHRGMTLQFSLQTQAIPEMLSLKEVCCQLKVGRHTIMKLIRRRDLRCYRIAHRYRFAVEDIKNYLEHIATY